VSSSVTRVAKAGIVVACFSFALWLVARELRHYDLPQVLAAARSIPTGTIVAALACTAASYYVLTLYDLLALRHVGRDIGYVRASLTSFTSYVSSHNLGLSGIGGTAVRYRLYTVFGLSSSEIAEVIAFCALTFWLGLLTAGGVVFIVEPIALPASLHALVGTLRPVGIVFVAVLLAIFAWPLVLRRPLRVRSWSFSPPSLRELLMQIALGVVDWCTAALVLFVLLPQGHGISFTQLLGVYLAAQAAGMVSHVPAGLGVFDALVLYLLRDQVRATDLAGVLVLYRVVYYLVPLALGTMTFVALEASVRRARIAAAHRWLQPLAAVLVPRALGFTTALGGAVLLLTGSLPAEGERMAWIREVVPLPAIEFSHFFGSLVGLALLMLSRGLLRRIDAAWWSSVALLSCGIALALVRAFDYEEAGVLSIMLFCLLPFRSVFHRRASILHDALRPRWWLALGMLVVAAIWLGSLAFRHVEYSHELWWRFSYEGDASRALRASAGLVTALGVVATYRLFSISPPRLVLPGPSELAEVRAILSRETSTTGHLALLGDKQILFDDERASFVMYAIHDSSWIAMGDPVGGSESARRELVWRFRELAEHAGGRAAFYQVSDEHLPWFAEAGFALLKLGEEALVDLASFTLEGNARKHLRASVHRLEREGVGFQVLSPSEVRANLFRLKDISDAWLGERAACEKGFSLGFFEPDCLAGAEVVVIAQGDRWLAFANLLLGAPGSELSIDLMRHVPEAPNGVMDFLFVRLFQLGQERGYRWFALGMTPLAGLESRTGAPVWNHLGDLVFRHGERFYNFQGLRQYKAKFDPVWRARYLATPGGLALPTVLVDTSILISGGIRAALAR